MYSPKIMLKKNLFTIYHQRGKELISLKDVFLSFKFSELSFEVFMLQFVFTNFIVDEEIIDIDANNDMFGMEKDKIDKLINLIV